MTSATKRRLRLWSALNLVGLLLVLVPAGAFTLLIVLLGTDHGESAIVDWLPRLAIGAAGGVVVAVLAGIADPRYQPWTAGLVLAGAVSATQVGLDLFPEGPLAVLPPAVGGSAVLRAWAGRSDDSRPAPGRQRLTALVVTTTVVVLAGLTTAYVAAHSRATPLYEAMRSDPMAAEELPGLAVRSDYSLDRTTPFGITSAAEVNRLWTIVDGSTRSAKLDDLEAMAADADWAPGPDPSFCGWTKTVDGFLLCLVIRPGVHPGQVIVTITEDGS